MNNEIVSRRTVFFNSTNRMTGEELWDLTMHMPTDIFSRDIQNNDTLELEMVQFNCIQSYYNIDTLRNAYFSYSENGTGNYVQGSIPVGNYSITELKTLIQTALNTVKTTLTWTVTLNMNTLKFTYTYIGSPAGTVYFGNYGSITGLDLLGFASETVISSGTTSSILVSIGNIPELIVHSDFSSDTEHLASSESLNTIFCTIPIYTSPFAPIAWEKASDYSPRIMLPLTGAGNSNVIKFSIRDSSDRFIRITKDWSMTLRVNVYRPRDTSFEKMMALHISEN